MRNIPRDISGRELSHSLQKFGYKITREAGSHIRLLSILKGKEHKITIPDHKEIRIGTMNSILNDVANYLGMPKAELIQELFD